MHNINKFRVGRHPIINNTLNLAICKINNLKYLFEPNNKIRSIFNQICFEVNTSCTEVP